MYASYKKETYPQSQSCDHWINSSDLHGDKIVWNKLESKVLVEKIKKINANNIGKCKWTIKLSLTFIALNSPNRNGQFVRIKRVLWKSTVIFRKWMQSLCDSFFCIRVIMINYRVDWRLVKGKKSAFHAYRIEKNSPQKTLNEK